MHATTLELEEYVSGALEPSRASVLDHHVEACALCARALLREAKLEVAVRAVGADLRCGMRADEVELVVPAVEEPQLPARRGAFFALAAAGMVVLAFAAAHLPKAQGIAPASGVLLSDAGDFTAVHQADSVDFAGETSGGTP
jgi:anti-sigma factor RsiW